MPAHAESKKSISTGFDYSSGTYGGTTTTDVLYVPVTGKIQYDDGYLKLTVPYISVTGTESVVRGVGRINTRTTTRRITQSGVGDVVVAAAYTVLDNDSLLLDIAGKTKFGTADASKNLGSGENDYSAQLDGFYTLNKTTLLATAGYKIVGAPASVNVNNLAYGTLGLSQSINSKTSAGAMLDAAQSSNEFSSGTRELTLFITKKLSNTLKVQAHLMKGYSDTSPDFGGGMTLTGSI